MLKVVLFAALVCGPSVAASGTYDVGVIQLPGSCVRSEYQNRAIAPWSAQRPNIVAHEGTQRISVLVLPSKPEAIQSSSERAAIERCVKGVASTVDARLLQNSTPTLEQDLARNVNQCLASSKAGVDIRFASLRREAIECR